MAVHPEQQQIETAARASVQGPTVVESALRAAVSERLGATRFGLWFGESVRLGLSGRGDSLEVRVPDPFFREWIQSHYTTSLLEAAEAVLGRPMQLSIRIHDEAEPPLGDVVEPAPPGPESEPEQRTSVTIPLPGNPKAPLSLPDPDLPGTSTPSGPFPLPRRIVPSLPSGCRRQRRPAVSHPRLGHRAGPCGGSKTS